MLKKRAFIVLMVMVITMTVCFEAWSEQNPQKTISQSKGGKLSAQKATNQKNPPIQYIIPQQMIDAITRAIDASNEKAKTTQYPPPPKDSSWLFQLFLTIFIGILAIVTVVQCYIIFNTLKATRIAANAAKDSAEVAQDTMIHGQRAYLSIDQIGFEKGLQVGDTPTLKLKIFNAGNTPAQIVSISTNVKVVDKIPSIPDYSLGRKSQTQMLMRASGDTTLANIQGDIITADQYTNIFNGKQIFLVWGRIIYQDIFKILIVVGFGVELYRDKFIHVDGYNYIEEYKEGDKAD